MTGTVGVPVSLNDSGSFDPDAGDWIASYKWTFGDGTSTTYSTAGIVTHTYAAAGTCTAMLTVTDSHGAMSSTTIQVTMTAPSTASGAFRWNRHVLASSGLDASGFMGVAHDSAGNVVAVGSGGRNIDWGTGVSTGDLSDGLIVKYSATGGLIWAKRLPAHNDSINAVAIDASDSIVVTGGFQDTIDFGAGTLTSVGSSDFFLAKYSSNGTLLWARQFGGLMVETGRGVVVDQSGNIFVIGFFSGTTNFGGGSVSAPSGGGVFLAKYSSSGAHLWSKSFPGGGSQQAGGIAIDDNGNIAVIGNFSGSVDFGGGSLTSAGGTDVFVAEYSPNGAHLWSRRGGGSGADLGYGIAVGPTGNVVAVGVFMGTANFGGSSFMSGGGTNDIFVAQYSSTGAHMWSESFGGELAYGSDTAKAVTVDGSGNVILTGNIQGPVDFGGGPLYGNNTGDIFVAKLNSNGDYLWAKRAGGDTDYDNGNAVVTDASGNVIVAGAFTLSCNFGGGLLTSPWGDATVVEFTP